jgi:hypothetical protein
VVVLQGEQQAGTDRFLTMLAILKVNAERGRGHLDNYLPFIYHCLSRSGAEVASAQDIQAELKAEFGFEVPQGVLQQLFDRAVKDNKLRLENRAYVVEPGSLDDCDLGEEEGRVRRGHRELIFELATFASEEFDLEWDEGKAESLLMRYVDGFSSKVLSAAVGGRDLPAPHELNEDDFVLHRFTSRIHERHVDLFERLVEVVKGRMLADALYFIPPSEPDLPSLEKVEIYFDGPLLLHVLGYAGAEIQAPYVELVELLKKQGSLLRCFEHSVTEAQEILDAAARKVRTGYVADRFHGDVVANLIRTGSSKSEIELLAERLPNDLLRVGIQPVATPERSARLQPDEEKLAKQLQDRIHYANSRARDRDLDSLTAIHRLRQGKTFRDLPKCRAILISHNYGVFRVSSRFFRTGGKSIPLCMYDSAFTTLVWLHEPHESHSCLETASWRVLTPHLTTRQSYGSTSTKRSTAFASRARSTTRMRISCALRMRPGKPSWITRVGASMRSLKVPRPRSLSAAGKQPAPMSRPI